MVVNVNKRDIVLSFSIGQAFPKVDGKLISVEVSGRELTKLLEVREISVSAIDNAFIAWHGKHAGRILKELRQLFDGGYVSTVQKEHHAAK